MRLLLICYDFRADLNGEDEQKQKNSLPNNFVQHEESSLMQRFQQAFPFRISNASLHIVLNLV